MPPQQPRVRAANKGTAVVNWILIDDPDDPDPNPAQIRVPNVDMDGFDHSVNDYAGVAVVGYEYDTPNRPNLRRIDNRSGWRPWQNDITELLSPSDNTTWRNRFGLPPTTPGNREQSILSMMGEVLGDDLELTDGQRIIFLHGEAVPDVVQPDDVGSMGRSSSPANRVRFTGDLRVTDDIRLPVAGDFNLSVGDEPEG